MNSIIVVGLQWGDEGKGKIVDALASGVDYVVRWNGGNNAGHTVVLNGVKYPLSHIPSGVLQRKKLLIAQGAVINPSVLLEEITRLNASGYPPKLMIDPRVHVVMPYHQKLDEATEVWKGKRATGSLHLGIGYCYEDRNNRIGIRIGDLLDKKKLKIILSDLLPLKTKVIAAYGLKATFDLDQIVQKYSQYASILTKYIADVSMLVDKNIDKKVFLFEQAHGTMLDPVFGTYPYTVAPSTLASAVWYSVGIAARMVPVLGVVKAYTTRVGNGPFLTEESGLIGETLRAAGGEFGTVSKRPRRCGWLDIPMIAYGVRINGVTKLAITKLDVLTGLPYIRVAIKYTRMGEPVYRTFPSWKQSISNIQIFAHLPIEARRYIAYIEQAVGVPVAYISTGAERASLITL